MAVAVQKVQSANHQKLAADLRQHKLFCTNRIMVATLDNAKAEV